MITSKNDFKQLYQDLYAKVIGDQMEEGQVYDHYNVLTRLIIDEINAKWAKSKSHQRIHQEKQVFYFSIEYLIGKMLRQYLIDLGLLQHTIEGLEEMGINFQQLEEFEAEPGLGNGGLGRLAACLMSSMTFKGIPAIGMGIRYRHGLFTQKIINGYQVELPDHWLQYNYPFEIRKERHYEQVKFYGKVSVQEENGRLTFQHKDYQVVKAVPYDVPILGYDQESQVNKLRLWNAEPLESFDLESFNQGDFLEAVKYQSYVEAISQVLYPNDNNQEGRLLRLKQEYFFVSAGIQNILRDYKKYNNNSLVGIEDKICIHINDTHPSLAIPEFMRLFIDEEGFNWEDSWSITTKMVSYTNHTIMPESMECWSKDILKELLPRIYMIIEEIHHRLKVNTPPIITDHQVNMANLAVTGSYSVNGVAKIHTVLLKRHVLKSFYNLMPDKFNNKTNGVDHRRFLLQANPILSSVITDTIGESWTKEPKDLNQLLNHLYDSEFRQQVAKAKLRNKEALAHYIYSQTGIQVDPTSIFDIQVKRIHAYKRQLLNALHIMYLYNQLMENPHLDIHPRTFIFAGKAAPGYALAKAIIKLIHEVASKVNNEPLLQDKIKVVFLDNFNVGLAEKIYPAADISEQISTASKEASGTGNMKFMMNGALTLATLDGANIEIREQVGDQNIFIFGLSPKEVLHYYKHGDYNPYEVYQNDVRLKQLMSQLTNGFFSNCKLELQSIYDSIFGNNDEFFVLKDFSSYVDTQQAVNYCYQDKQRWLTMVINNIARSGIFSSDRTVTDYAKGIWHTKLD